MSLALSLVSALRSYKLESKDFLRPVEPDGRLLEKGSLVFANLNLIQYYLVVYIKLTNNEKNIGKVDAYIP